MLSSFVETSLSVDCCYLRRGKKVMFSPDVSVSVFPLESYERISMNLFRCFYSQGGSTSLYTPF